MRLMIFDDSNMIRTSISWVVQGGSLKNVAIVGLAKNGLEAVRIAKVARPDVITMELTMPEMDGTVSIAALLKLDPDVNILVVSALSDKSTATAALQLGARGFVAKPFTVEKLQIALLDVSDLR